MDSSFSLVRVKTDIQDLMLCSMAKEGMISDTINNVLYALVEYSPLSWPYCVHSTYARTWGCTEVPGSALGNNCDKMHRLHPHRVHCPSDVPLYLRCGFIPTDCALLIMLIMMSATFASSRLAWNLFTTVLYMNGWRTTTTLRSPEAF